MELTNTEARYLLDHLSEMVTYGDPLHSDTIIEAGIIAKLVDYYPSEADSVREQRELEQIKIMEENRKRRDEEN